MSKPIDDGKQSKGGDNWISVKDRLPEENVWVLTIGFWDFGDMSLGSNFRYKVDFLTYSAREKSLVWCSNLQQKQRVITDWMPLPEPPVKDD